MLSLAQIYYVLQALHLAAAARSSWSYAAAMLLLEAGADVHAWNAEGETVSAKGKAGAHESHITDIQPAGAPHVGWLTLAKCPDAFARHANCYAKP